MNKTKALVEMTAVFAITLAVVGFLWSVTGKTMMKNYAECGTIFLCANQ